MNRGDHLSVWRGAYSHHGIDVGGNRVIHYGGVRGGKRNAIICYTTWRAFAAGNEVEVVHHRNAAAPSVVVQRAESRLGENGYNLFGNNCEHFATWCKTGRQESQQVEAVKSVGGFGTGAALVGAAGPVAVVPAVGYGAYRAWKWLRD